MLAHVKRIFSSSNIPVDFNDVELNSKDPLDEELEKVVNAIHKTGAALKGNIETKFDNPDFKSRNMELRRRLDLYANVLHCVSVPTIHSRHKDLDLVLIRENTEGEYSGLEHESVNGIVESLKIVTRHGIERIARYAYDYAVLNNRPNIIVIHKANIQKLGDGLFLKVAKEICDTEYKSKGLRFDSLIVDNACMQLVSRPQQFNNAILLMPNLYGNIISNIACGLVGGPGLVPGMNIGEEYAVFETLDSYADKMSDALFIALTERKLHTPDIGGSCHSTDIVDAVIDLMQK
uniref:Isopropylmalate dehydrogenase-like domain-containing protein n=1 Tax=Meloidogyne javanica TaxID=6303 RepID=A0A915LVQ9_MELJA